MKQLLFSIALLATSASATATPWQEVETHSTRVGYADLDLGSAHGQAVLRRRTETAIRRLCTEPGLSSPDARSRQSACEAEAHRNVDPAIRQALAQSAPRLIQQAMLQPTSR